MFLSSLNTLATVLSLSFSDVHGSTQVHGMWASRALSSRLRTGVAALSRRRDRIPRRAYPEAELLYANCVCGSSDARRQSRLLSRRLHAFMHSPRRTPLAVPGAPARHAVQSPASKCGVARWSSLRFDLDFGVLGERGLAGWLTARYRWCESVTASCL